MLSLSLLLIECKKTGKKKGHGMIWRFSTGFCNFSRYKILCCTAAPMQKIAVVLVVNMSLAWHKKLKM